MFFFVTSIHFAVPFRNGRKRLRSKKVFYIITCTNGAERNGEWGMEWNETERNRTKQNETEQNRTKQNETEKISPKQIDGPMHKPITTLPTPSGTRHESGCHQLSTGHWTASNFFVHGTFLLPKALLIRVGPREILDKFAELGINVCLPYFHRYFLVSIFKGGSIGFLGSGNTFPPDWAQTFRLA